VSPDWIELLVTEVMGESPTTASTIDVVKQLDRALDEWHPFNILTFLWIVRARVQGNEEELREAEIDDEFFLQCAEAPYNDIFWLLTLIKLKLETDWPKDRRARQVIGKCCNEYWEDTMVEVLRKLSESMGT